MSFILQGLSAANSYVDAALSFRESDVHLANVVGIKLILQKKSLNEINEYSSFLSYLDIIDNLIKSFSLSFISEEARTRSNFDPFIFKTAFAK